MCCEVVIFVLIIDFSKVEDLLKDIATIEFEIHKLRITLMMLISLFEVCSWSNIESGTTIELKITPQLFWMMCVVELVR